MIKTNKDTQIVRRQGLNKPSDIVFNYHMAMLSIEQMGKVIKILYRMAPSLFRESK